MRKTLPALLVLVAVAGCSAQHSPAATMHTSDPCQHARSAGTIANAMHIPGVTSVNVWTAQTDPNHLLGRPNGYTSAATLENPAIHGGIESGTAAKVEVWPSVSAAKARESYIEGILKASPALGSEYDYVDGGALLRVSGTLTPGDARQYDAAFRSAVGC